MERDKSAIFGATKSDRDSFKRDPFVHFRDILRSCSDPDECWAEIIALTGLGEKAVLRNLELQKDIAEAVKQVRLLFENEPPQHELSFIYFGIFDAIDPASNLNRTGFYVAGGTGDQEKQIALGELSYFPRGRSLTVASLAALRELAKLDPQCREAYEYLLAFGAAGIIAKFTAAALPTDIPIYVGFDSGDVARIR